MNARKRQAGTTDTSAAARETAAVRPEAPAAAAELRIDGPHGVADGAEAGTAPPDQPMALQLNQLASHLRVRQEELDQRESHVNAQAAQVEQGRRAARLWVAEREADLRGRREALDREELESKQRLERLAAAEAALVDRQRQWAEQEEILAQREAAVELRSQVLAEQMSSHRQALKAFEAERERVSDELTFQRQQADAHREASLVLIHQLWEGLERHRAACEAEAERGQARSAEARPRRGSPADDLRRQRDALAARWQKLEQAEAELAAQQADHQRLHEELTQRLAEADETVRQQRRAIVAEQRQQWADLETKRQAVQRRSEHVDQARNALEQLRGELSRIHRETLEIRVATEELWIQLSGAAPAAKLTRSLSQVRSKLMEDYRLVNQQHEQQRQELAAIRAELAQEHERFVRHKAQFEAWVEQRNRELEATTDRLVDRERHLDRKEAQMAEEVRAWEIERLEYQQELRRLRKQADQPEPWLSVAESLS